MTTRNEKILVLTVASIVLGITLYSANNELLLKKKIDLNSAQKLEKTEKDSKNSNYSLGSAHEHAQFFVNIEGKDFNFSKKKYQLRSKYVHMENFRPHIVHKHAENITWKFFLETMEIKILNSENHSCLEISGNKSCGNLSIILNGKEIGSLDREIQQGDRLALMMPFNENLSRNHMKKDLPPEFKPNTGFEV